MKYIHELNEKFGTNIRDNIVKDIAQGRVIGPNKIRRTAIFLAIIINLTAYCVAAGGVAIIAFNYDRIAMIAIGLFFIATGYYLHAPRLRNTLPTLRNDDAPTLFALIDDIATSLGAPAISGVHINSETNAYMADYGSNERIVGIGAPLWLALTPTERLAIIAHKIAHLINNDPAHGHLTFRALDTLQRWHNLIGPPDTVNIETHNISKGGLSPIEKLFALVLSGPLEAITIGFEKLIFVDGQRAKYLADVTATSIAGIHAQNTFLKKIILSPLAEDALAHAHFDGTKHVPIFEKMAKAMSEPKTNDADRLFKEAIKSLHTVDSTHPPTRYRMEVVAAAGVERPSIEASNIDWASIDQELANYINREEQKLLSQIIVQ